MGSSRPRADCWPRWPPLRRHTGRCRVAPQPTLKPGTVLLREWHGTHHQVIVREDGIVFRGQPHMSLSEVAHRITGTNWSGPASSDLIQRVIGSAMDQAKPK